jgi:tetraacyldisaccharide 4'-kinase
MRQRLEHWLNEIWYGGGSPPAWLLWLVPLYRMLLRLDRRWKLARQPEDLSDKWIVVVGNLTVGGSGKTPLVIRLCRVLEKAGLHPGVVSRGYGRKSNQLIQVVPGCSANDTGDEPLVIARRTGVPVVVSADRCAGARHLFEQGINVVISDDGLQHHRLPRKVEICVVDGEREFGNGLLLPAGPLREPLSRLGEVDFVVINGAEHVQGVSQEATRMQFVPGLLYALNGEETWRLSQFSGCRVNALAGIGNPERFFKSLEQAGLHVEKHVFPDHHAFSASDFSSLEPGWPIIMTEKDAVKCRGLELDNAWYLSVEASLPSSWEQDFLVRLSATQSQTPQSG